jgi:hypothetical protein
MNHPIRQPHLCRRFRPPTIVLLVVALIVVSCPLVRGGEHNALSPRHSITFVQLTDAHIFDEGWRQATAEALREAADDRTALHWAIQEINHIVSSGTQVDFVAYTGDLGLQNIDFPRAPGCQALPLHLEPGLPPSMLESAVNEVAAEFNQLVVRRVYLVPGNNDLENENVTDRRYDCFVDLLRSRLRAVRQPLELVALQADSSIDVNGFQLVGLNTASFKAMRNYDAACSETTRSTGRARLREGCPQPQFESLKNLILHGKAGRALLFTHVPDLKDPYRHTPAWDITDSARKVWEDAVCGPSVLGLFAGHFHDSDRALYGAVSGTRHLATSTCIAGKTWIAPPLAVKNQLGKEPPARGFLLATVTDSNVIHAGVHWFSAALPAQSQSRVTGAPDATGKCVSKAFLLTLTVLDFVALIAGFIWLRRSRLKVSVAEPIWADTVSRDERLGHQDIPDEGTR